MKGRIKNILKKIMKYPITIWMVISILALITIYIAYAAYNGTAIVKRVVSTQPTSTSVFSSNYLEEYSSNITVKDLRTTTEGNFTVSVTVCNYDQMDVNSYAKGLIEYELKAELVHQVGDDYELVNSVQMNGDVPKIFNIQKTMDDNVATSGETVNDLNVNPFIVTYPVESLTGGSPLKDSFNICFDAAEVAKETPDLFIRVTATPTEQSVQLNSGITTLACIISVSQGRSVETGWHGSLQETDSSEEYDAYNLIIEGSGVGEIDILWDNTEFTMNPKFVELYSAKLTRESDVLDRPGWKKRTLSVNSMQENRYDVQFYKKKPSATGTGKILCNNYNATPIN